jgi:hypothetical protein
MIPAALQAKTGEKILPKFKELVKWIDSQRLVSVDDRVTINTTPNGSLVSMVDRAPSISTPLEVRLTGLDKVTISEGYINGRLPKIKPVTGDLQDIVNLDGIAAPPARLPTKRPIVVCALVVFDQFFKLTNAEIVYEEPQKIPRTGSANYSIDSKLISGVIPLAYLRSNRFIQFVTHNIQVRAFLHNGSYRIIYWPA